MPLIFYKKEECVILDVRAQRNQEYVQTVLIMKVLQVTKIPFLPYNVSSQSKSNNILEISVYFLEVASPSLDV